MSRVVVHAGLRTRMTKGETHQIRKSGGVIANLYGKDRTPIAIYVEPASVADVLNHGRGLIDISIVGDGTYSVMTKQIDRHPIKKNVIHIDFHAVNLKENVEVEVPVILNGMEQVEKQGGIIMQHVREIKIRTMPTQIPEHLLVDISHMGIGDHLSAGDVAMPAGCELREDADLHIVSIVSADAPTADAPEEPKEPEIVHDQEGKGDETLV